MYLFVGEELKELALPFIDWECSLLFRFVSLSIDAWSVPTVSGAAVLFKVGSLHFHFCLISCHLRGVTQADLPNQSPVGILELKCYIVVNGGQLYSITHL